MRKVERFFIFLMIGVIIFAVLAIPVAVIGRLFFTGNTGALWGSYLTVAITGTVANAINGVVMFD